MEFKTAYLAPEGLEEPVERELARGYSRYGRLFLAEGEPQQVRWAQNIWYDVREFKFRSIGEAAAYLRGLHGLWVYYPLASVRRGALIQERLPYFRSKEIPFPPPSLPKAPLGSWTLLDEHTLIAAPRTSSLFPHGEVYFQESKEPPSRAYLKLWEFFTRIGTMPKKGTRCLELGASPGGWTWVLDQLGADVTAVDRSPLDPKLKQVPFLKKDAFSIRPQDFPDVEWIFSDVVCYPKKLLEWIRPWLDKKIQFVCSLKFQGAEDNDVLSEFEKYGRIIRLYHNKHELTWYRLFDQGHV